MTLVLASGSPRRHVLLALLVPDFEVVPAHSDETLPEGPLEDGVTALAARKALEVSLARPGTLVLGADTLVESGGTVLGKAADTAEARRTLRGLSGKEHRALTAIALVRDGAVLGTHCSLAPVRFDRLPDKVLEAYLEDRAWVGKAGCYGIQDAALAPHVHVAAKHWSTVVGLPLESTAGLLRAHGMPCQDPPDPGWLVLHNPF